LSQKLLKKQFQRPLLVLMISDQIILEIY